MTLPTSVAINAWVGPGRISTADLDDNAPNWSMRDDFPTPGGLLGPEAAVAATNWRHHQHGWGIILPEPAEPGWSNQDKAWAKDAPSSVQDLIKKRLPPEAGPAPVFRYNPQLPAFLRRYFPDGSVSEPRFGERIGLQGKQRVPRYLLIIGSPDRIPWQLQYTLNQNHLVGRLDLDEAGLGNYVEALLSGWKDADADPQVASLWSVDLGNNDITNEMKATPVFDLLHNDPELVAGTQNLTDLDATREKLLTSLDRHPGLIVTTSHGKTSPLGDTKADQQLLGDTLGVLVDRNDAFVDPQFLENWSPEGAIWYAHACCSAGADNGTSYTGLLAEGGLAHKVVHGVARLDPVVSPLPRNLLGREQPLRAFIGQVEPTFDWTLRDELNRQPLTDGIEEGLYQKLFQPWPVALGFGQYHHSVGQLYKEWADLRDALNDGDGTVLHDATRIRLTAIDRESLVILGDPTVALPPLPSQQK
jgi:hypothetical protein